METLEKVIGDINRLAELSKNGEYDLVTVAFTLATAISDFEDVDVLRAVPVEVVEKFIQLVSGYKETGEYLVVSNVGVADHSEMFQKVVNILDDNNVEL